MLTHHHRRHRRRRLAQGKDSWDVFKEIMEKVQVVTTPGSGFGPSGQGFVRVSAFGHRADVLEACERFKANWA